MSVISAREHTELLRLNISLVLGTPAGSDPAGGAGRPGFSHWFEASKQEASLMAFWFLQTHERLYFVVCFHQNQNQAGGAHQPAAEPAACGSSRTENSESQFHILVLGVSGSPSMETQESVHVLLWSRWTPVAVGVSVTL